MANNAQGLTRLDITSVGGSSNDTPPLIGMDWHKREGAVVDYRNGVICFWDAVPRKAYRLPQGPRGLHLLPLLGQKMEEVPLEGVLRELVNVATTDGKTTTHDNDTNKETTKDHDIDAE